MDKPDLKSIKDFPPQVVTLFDKYVHGDIDKRGFLELAGKYCVGGLTAATYLSALAPNFARAQKISPSDPRLWIEDIHIPSPKGSGVINAYMARPKDLPFLKAIGVVIVAHENRGLNPHIRDIARRIALEGFIAIAPDALTSLGGYPGNEDEARAKFATLDQNKIKADFVATAKFCKIVEHSNRKIGVIGFCWGGGMANYLATQVPYLRAAVPFYGAAAPLENVANIKAKLQLHFAKDDTRFNEMWPPYESALKTHHKPYEAFMYEGTQHGFNNDTTPRFNQGAAALAWGRAMSFFKAQLR